MVLIYISQHVCFLNSFGGLFSVFKVSEFLKSLCPWASEVFGESAIQSVRSLHC